METSQSGMDTKKNPIDSMSRDELITKYKGLLGIAKQAKKAKDEFAEENQKLKEQLTNCETQREADKKSLLTMKEMLEEFTKNKLAMSTENSELRAINKSLVEEQTSVKSDVEKLSIENEALRRQVDRLTEDNDSLLTDIDQMEQQLKQVNVLGMEQKKNLDLLELEVEKLKEYEVTSRQLEAQLQDLIEVNKSLQESCTTSQTESQNLAAKYQSLKEMNSEQRTKFNSLKERFIEVHKKLKQLQECKRILVESHHEYADSISRWQLEIMQASEQLCNHIQTLSKENTDLKKEIQTANGDVSIALPQLPVLIEYCESALVEYRRQNEVIEELKKENEELRSNASQAGELNVSTTNQSFDNQVLCLTVDKASLEEELARVKISSEEAVSRLERENAKLREEYSHVKASSELSTTELRASLEEELARVRFSSEEALSRLESENAKLREEYSHVKASSELSTTELRASLEEELARVRFSSEEALSRLESENAKLREENSHVKASSELSITELRASLEKELTRVKFSSEEALSRLESENAKLREDNSHAKAASDRSTAAEIALLEEELARFKLSSEETLNRLEMEKAKLREENNPEKALELQEQRASLEEELAKVKLSSQEALSHLEAENKKLKEETDVKVKLLRDESATLLKTRVDEVERLRNDLSASSAFESVVLSHLPHLVACCEKALSEQSDQLKLLNTLKQENDAKAAMVAKTIEELGALKELNASLRDKVARTEFDTQTNFNIDLDALRTENERLKEELSKFKQIEADVQDIHKLRSDLLNTTHLCEDLQTKLEKQERENTDLLNEMRELNEALKGRGDVISRQQEKHQELVAEIKKTSSALAKIEADLSAKESIIQEKEQKISKMSEDNHAALQEVNKLQNLSRENEARIKTLSDEISAMRTQVENHDAQSEALSTSTISRAEELARLREVDESFEEKYNKLRSLAVKLKKKAHEQTLTIAELEKQLADSKVKSSESSEKVAKLENECESLQKELKASKTQADSLKAEVDKLKASKKQSNVLTLEIEAFEKSLNDTTAKLTAKTAEHELLRERLQSKESAIEVMKKEIKILEEGKESEKAHSVELKKEIDKLQAQVKDVIHSKQEVSAKLEECQTEKQSLQTELDEVNQKLSSIAAEREVERTSLQKEKENLLRTISSLEDELNVLNNRITLAERSFQDLNNEYSNYKVKAQSVLRQNQTKESSRERELEEELTLLKGEHDDLSSRLQTFLEKFQASEKANEELQEETRFLQSRSAELMHTITELRQQTETLVQENKKHLETYQETLKGHRLQIEALNSCHMEQMQEQQASYDREIAALKQIQKRDSETFIQKPLEKLDYILMEREDAEGSEAETIHTPKYLPSRKRSSHDLVPLDELLNSPAVDSAYTVLERTRSISPTVELQETKEQLHKQESRVRHLTALLAESEQDLARLTQLNEMLKEEVRRQERTVEREKHMQNSEYLKNVVLKFVSLSNGDERTRLVPVLNTILRLSPTETEMLQNIAKGKGPDNNNRSWGSFLPHWGTS